MKKKIAIIGSGIAGLTLANFLYKDKNYEFMVYEKNESLPLDEGYGIQLSTNSIKILNKINFNKINSENIYHPNGIDFYNIQNKKICDLDLIQFNVNNNKYTTLQRSTLIEFLKDDIYTQHIRFGKRIKQVSELKGKVFIKFDDNTNDLVDYVVGADGIFSNTRTFFEKKINKPVFKNALAVRTILNSTSGLSIDQSKISLMMGKNCHLVIYPINKNKEPNLVCILRHKKTHPDNIKTLLKEVVKQNHNLEKVLKDNLKSWPLYATPKMLPSSNSKVFYIGDAFNGFLPTLAQGAGQSIESAYELFNLIKDERGDKQNNYFQERSKRAKLIRRRSNFNFFIFHLSSKFMQTIRNFFMKFLLKRKSFINSYLGTVYKN
jgi:salicylate hydroxylase